MERSLSDGAQSKWAAINPATKCNLSTWARQPDAKVIAQERLGQAINDGYFGTPTNRAPVNWPSLFTSGA
jgi:hypothetical protein